MENRLLSEKVVVSAPMSFHGSAARIWKITYTDNTVKRWLVFVPVALLLTSFAWIVVASWYLFFGIWLVPYRLIRRGDRKNKRDKLRHRELLTAIEKSGADKTLGL